jgi:hypothetical protein
MIGTSVTPRRRAVRRAARTRCHAVSAQGFELLGERALDLSPRGMLVACDAPAALGEEVFVSFVTPGPEPLWLDAEAEIARIVHGFRQSDPGYCIGLRFTHFERRDRAELLARLSGYPPPVPGRRLKTLRAREPEPGPGESLRNNTVLLSPVLWISKARGGIPAGVFHA